MLQRSLNVAWAPDGVGEGPHNATRVQSPLLKEDFAAMHFIVFGAGAIGCYVGGRLAAHGRLAAVHHTLTAAGRSDRAYAARA